MARNVQTRPKTLSDLAHAWRMTCRRARLLRFVSLSVCLSALVLAGPASASPKATLVMDARTGEIFSQDNADVRLHPASLTKMMTLYLAFEAAERGELTMDTPIRISANASGEIPSKLGLKTGQEIQLRYLVRAAAVKSANDAATAIAEGISGSEEAFVDRMNRTALAMGMMSTHFENAHGLTEPTHLSTARDMSVLARHLLYDYPDYYNLFSRLSADAGVARVSHTNRSFLTGYSGADGIKTGYTRAAGFNLVASAMRGNERIIATIFGASSVSERTRTAAELIDSGFARAPSQVAEIPPARPQSSGPSLASLRGSTVQDHPLYGAFSYDELIAGRQAHRIDETLSPPSPAIRRGSFSAVTIPQMLVQVSRASAHSQDEILAGATAVVSELKRGSGTHSPAARTSNIDTSEAAQPRPITRVGMSDLDRALMRGSEIPMGPASARPQPTPDRARRGGFRPVALPHPIILRQDQAQTTGQARGMDELFNIDDLYKVPDIPQNSIFSRSDDKHLPSGPLVDPIRPRARQDAGRPAQQQETLVAQSDTPALPDQEGSPTDPVKPEALATPAQTAGAIAPAIDSVPVAPAADPRTPGAIDTEVAPDSDGSDEEDAAAAAPTKSAGPKPIVLPW